MAVQEVSVPPFLYGTAWKEEQTEGLVRLALEAGFRGIDTANQRRHYFEEGVGKAVAGVLGAGTLRREDLFLQTKFTHKEGQDHRLPYERSAPPSLQVEQSFASSLQHLGVDRIDSFVLHGPSTRDGLAPIDWEVWRAMEALHQQGKTRLLAVSNVSLAQLETLHSKATVKPAMVQNRCYASQGWDREVRSFCRNHGMHYQAFSLLTANREVLRDSRVTAIAARTRRTVPQVIFRFSQQAGMLPLTGTTSTTHMHEDLLIGDFSLDDDDVRTLEALAG